MFIFLTMFLILIIIFFFFFWRNFTVGKQSGIKIIAGRMNVSLILKSSDWVCIKRGTVNNCLNAVKIKKKIFFRWNSWKKTAIKIWLIIVWLCNNLTACVISTNVFCMFSVQIVGGTKVTVRIQLFFFLLTFYLPPIMRLNFFFSVCVI